MHRLVPVGLILFAAACADPVSPPSATDDALALGHSRGNPDQQHVYNTQLRAANEAPHTSTSVALGHAQVKIRDGIITYKVQINNRGLESFTACHIHWHAPGAPAGGIVWHLPITPSSARKIDERGTAVFNNVATNPLFGLGAAGALAELLSDPDSFYVNCHTQAIPAGAIRGELP